MQLVPSKAQARAGHFLEPAPGIQTLPSVGHVEELAPMGHASWSANRNWGKQRAGSDVGSDGGV